ncbi:MAG: CapA family protein [Defluviitaleaceae bacterium]|nr:CapA family protein [Defluviitaleaceae bacterium]
MSNKRIIIILSSVAVLSIALAVAIFAMANRQGNGEETLYISQATEPPTEPVTEPPTEPPTEPEPVLHTARLAFVGDIMVHQEQLNAARVSPGVYDFNYKFRYIAPFLQGADFTIGNLETTLVPSHRGYAGWPLFRTPGSMADALVNAGFDMVTTGNNHAFDDFVPGVRSTIELLNEAGLAFTGTFLEPEDRYEVTMVEVNGFTFAIISMTYAANGIDLGSHNYMVKFIYHDLVEQHTIDYDLIRDSIARARALNPDFIVMSPHIGLEYYGTMGQVGAGHRWDTFNHTTDGRWFNWMRTLHFMLEAGADIIMSHHPHTLLPAEFVYVTNEDGTIRRAFIAYSMANFVSAQRTQPRETSAVFYLEFERWDDGEATIASASYSPIWVRQHDPTRSGLDFTVLPIEQTLRRVDSGEATPDLRPQDIERMRRARLDVTHMLSGEPIPAQYMQDEYEITRYRNLEQWPGLPLWGTLPWR